MDQSWGTTATVHGTRAVLDPLYVPGDPDAARLFIMHNQWMFSVMEQKLITDQCGKVTARQHIATQDGQSVWRDVRQNARASTTGQITTELILKHLSSV